MFSILRWTDHLQQKSSKSTLPIPQYTMQLLSCNPMYLPHSFPKSSLSFKLGQGRACLIGTAKNLRFVFFLREKTFTFIIYTCRATAQKPDRSALIQILAFSSSLIISYCQGHLIVPCCTFTIHKGYYIVLHSSHSPDYPMLQPARPFHPLNKIFSALVFKSNIFMVDGLPTTVRFPQLSLKNCQSLSSSNDRWLLGAVKSSEFFP